MAQKNDHVSRYIDSFINHLPAEQRKKILVDRKIRRTHEQFAACVDPFILKHVNSVYLIKEDADEKDSNTSDVPRETFQKLTAYVDNSLIAAELNAQRELIVLKYRELFGIQLSEFSIKISRGAYKENHPFLDKNTAEKPRPFHQLSEQEEHEIEALTLKISDPQIRESFQRAIKATKEHPLTE